MATNNVEEVLPQFCQTCGEEGFYVIPNPEDAYVLKCVACGTLYSYAWCEKCGMGGDFVLDVESDPHYWNCPSCKTQYPLPSSFHSKHLRLYPYSILPSQLRERVHYSPSPLFSTLARVKPFWVFLRQPLSIFFFLIFGVVFIMHLKALFQKQEDFTAPIFFFAISIIAFIIGILPFDDIRSTEEVLQKSFRKIPVIFKVVLMGILIYGVLTFAYSFAITGGRAATELEPDQRLIADWLTVLCIQNLWMLFLLLGAISLWYRKPSSW